MKKSNKQAFTLIELLVVVLIIGILAAVAVPQYQKAIYKSRATEALSAVKALMQAQEVYYLANGEYTADISKLDVEAPVDSNYYQYRCVATGYCQAFSNTQSVPNFDFYVPQVNKGVHLCGGTKKMRLLNLFVKAWEVFYFTIGINILGRLGIILLLTKPLK